MKRIIVTGAVLMLGLTLSFGQDILKEYGYALYGGVSISNFDKGSTKSSALPGLHFGGAIEIPVTAKFSIQPGLEISMKGGKYDRLIPDGFIEREIRVNGLPVDENEDGFPDMETVAADTITQSGVSERLLYIQVPILAYTHFEVGTGKLFVAAGPYVGAGIFSHASEADATDKKAPFFTKQYKQLDFGIQVKAGFELPSGWFASIGYDYGLYNISNNEISADLKTKNGAVLFSIGRKVWGY